MVEFKGTIEYTQRKTHALIIAVAAYFSNLQEHGAVDRTILFNLAQYHAQFVRNRELQIDIGDFI